MASKREIVAELKAKRAVEVRERAERERANLSDVAEFVTQQAREEQVAVWLELMVGRLEGAADRRRVKCRAAAGAALAKMIGRGVSVKEAAELVGITAAKVQEYLLVAPDPSVSAQRLGAVVTTTSAAGWGSLE